MSRRPGAAILLVVLLLVAALGAGCGGDAGTRTIDEPTQGDQAADAVEEPDGGWETLLAPTSECEGQEDADANARRLRDAAGCLINHAREERGLPELSRSGELQDAADGKLADIVRCGEFSHTACDRGEEYWFGEVEYLDGCRGGGHGENLGIGEGRRGAPRRVVLSWLDSPGHRRNMLSEQWEEQAVAVQKQASWEGSVGSDERTFQDVNVWVSHFGTRRGC